MLRPQPPCGSREIRDRTAPSSRHSTFSLCSLRRKGTLEPPWGHIKVCLRAFCEGLIPDLSLPRWGKGCLGRSGHLAPRLSLLSWDGGTGGALARSPHHGRGLLDSPGVPLPLETASRSCLAGQRGQEPEALRSLKGGGIICPLGFQASSQSC